MPVNFASDNWAGAHPAVAKALFDQSGGFAAAYCLSDVDRRVEKRFCEVFEREVAVFFVATGTAANALSMAFLNRPGGVAFGHRHAHMLEDEGGAPEYLTGGARMHPVAGKLGRMEPQALEEAISQFPAEFIHSGQPMAVSVTQATEIGTIYSLDQIGAIADLCRAHRLPLHMDGARFANALAALGTTAAEMTWKRGVDIVSFGGTKNGCWCAEAIVIMDPARAGDMHFLRKRAAHLFSKSRFIAAQFEAYFHDGLWLENARWSNAMAARLASHLKAAAGVRLAWEPQTNEVFAVMREKDAETLQAKGASFHPWKAPADDDLELAPGEALYRFVTSFATTEDEVDAFGRMLGA